MVNEVDLGAMRKQDWGSVSIGGIDVEGHGDEHGLSLGELCGQAGVNKEPKTTEMGDEVGSTTFKVCP